MKKVLQIVGVLVLVGIIFVLRLPETKQPQPVLEEVATGSAPIVTEEAKTSAAVLRDEYAALGSPNADELSDDFAARLMQAYQEGRLTTIESVTSGLATVSLVSVADKSETNAEYCGIYAPGMCMLVFSRVVDSRLPTRPAFIFDASRSSGLGMPHTGHIHLVSLLESDPVSRFLYRLVFTSSIGDAGYGEENGYVLDLNTKELTLIARLTSSWNGDNGDFTLSMERGATKLHLTVFFTETADGPVVYHQANLRDESGILKTFGGPIVEPTEAWATFNYVSMIEDSNVLLFNLFDGKSYRYNPSAVPRLTEI